MVQRLPRFPAPRALVLTALAALPGVVRAQIDSIRYPVRGRVVDAAAVAPVAGVRVVLTRGDDTLGRGATDSTGAFQLWVRDTARLVVHFGFVGYRPDSITSAPGAEIPLRVAMVPIRSAVATRLTPVRVEAGANSAFERRARRNAGGHFIRRQQIEQQKPLRTGDLFRTIPGVTLDDSAGIVRLISARGVRQTSMRTLGGQAAAANGTGAAVIGGDTVTGPMSGAEHCVLRIGLDGRLQDATFSINDIRPEEIQALELYLGVATIPIEFSTVQRNAPCGIVMIWSRVGSSK